MREVGVHLEDEIVAPLDGIVETSDIRSPKAQLAGPVHHMNCVVARRHLVGDLASAIGRVVVDDEDIGRGRGALDSLHQIDDIIPLVIGGNRDNCSHSMFSSDASRESRSATTDELAQACPSSASPQSVTCISLVYVYTYHHVSGADISRRVRAGR